MLVSNMSQRPAYQSYADHAFGDGAFNWMPSPEPIYKRPNLQPNATFHVSALAPEVKPNAIARAMSKSAAGSNDTAAAPKAKGSGNNKSNGQGLLAAFIGALAPPNRSDLVYGTGFGRHKLLDLD